MFCGNCGKKIKDGINFCPYCGARVSGSAAKMNAPASPASANANSVQKTQEMPQINDNATGIDTAGTEIAAAQSELISDDLLQHNRLITDSVWNYDGSNMFQLGSRQLVIDPQMMKYRAAYAGFEAAVMNYTGDCLGLLKIAGKEKDGGEIVNALALASSGIALVHYTTLTMLHSLKEQYPSLPQSYIDNYHPVMMEDTEGYKPYRGLLEQYMDAVMELQSYQGQHGGFKEGMPVRTGFWVRIDTDPVNALASFGFDEIPFALMNMHTGLMLGIKSFADLPGNIHNVRLQKRIDRIKKIEKKLSKASLADSIAVQMIQLLDDDKQYLMAAIDLAEGTQGCFAQAEEAAYNAFSGLKFNLLNAKKNEDAVLNICQQFPYNNDVITALLDYSDKYNIPFEQTQRFASIMNRCAYETWAIDHAKLGDDSDVEKPWKHALSGKAERQAEQLLFIKNDSAMPGLLDEFRALSRFCLQGKVMTELKQIPQIDSLVNAEQQNVLSRDDREVIYGKASSVLFRHGFIDGETLDHLAGFGGTVKGGKSTDDYLNRLLACYEGDLVVDGHQFGTMREANEADREFSQIRAQKWFSDPLTYYRPEVMRQAASWIEDAFPNSAFIQEEADYLRKRSDGVEAECRQYNYPDQYASLFNQYRSQDPNLVIPFGYAFVEKAKETMDAYHVSYGWNKQNSRVFLPIAVFPNATRANGVVLCAEGIMNIGGDEDNPVYNSALFANITSVKGKKPLIGDGSVEIEGDRIQNLNPEDPAGPDTAPADDESEEDSTPDYTMGGYFLVNKKQVDMIVSVVEQLRRR